MKACVSLGVLAIVANLAACDGARLEPRTRPAGVPSTAIWVGGGDGGAYVQCSTDAVHDVNRCGVWNDFTGGLVESGEYRLVREKRAATESELRITFPDFNGLIYLEDVRILKRL